MSPLSRRQFLAAVAAATTSVATHPCSGAAEPKTPGRRLSVALMLHSLRHDCEADLDATLARVAERGFEAVEFSGYYRYTEKPKELRSRLDGLGLKAPATHIGTAHFRGDAFKRTIEFHQAIGCKYLIVARDPDFVHPERSKAFADLMNRCSATLTPLGLKCGYHNRSVEFAKVGAKTWFDLFAERTTKDVVLQLDCGWAVAAGVDPADLMRKYPGRMGSVHFKPTVLRGEKTRKAFLGQDSLNWPAIIAACRSHGGTEWISLEQEAHPDGKTPMECVEISLVALRKIL